MTKSKSNYGDKSVKFNHKDKIPDEAKNSNHMIRTVSSNRENRRLSQCT